mmetsp:Transcript_22492/g.22768  ORF Transcript_22492/g.22768 Transcript_22492/m.22768 type:complete len:139 (+) Transcript_22492:258-674(+)
MDRKFREIVGTKKEHNTFTVLKKVDPKLAAWTATQRTNYRNNWMSADRSNCLESVDFVFGRKNSIPKEVRWDDIFQRLVNYQKEYKSSNSNIPCDYKEDKKLKAWACSQRVVYNKKKLSMYRITRLHSYDFVWDLKKN